MKSLYIPQHLSNMCVPAISGSLACACLMRDTPEQTNRISEALSCACVKRKRTCQAYTSTDVQQARCCAACGERDLPLAGNMTRSQVRTGSLSPPPHPLLEHKRVAAAREPAARGLRQARRAGSRPSVLRTLLLPPPPTHPPPPPHPHRLLCSGATQVSS